MPLTRKQQILFKRETSEGVNASPGASDAVLVYEPSISDNVETSDRTPAGSSLSREVVPTGRKTRTISFQSDFRGSGDTTIDVDVPEWGTMLECSAYSFVQPVNLPVTSPSGNGFHLGEIVQKDSSKRAIVIGLFNGAGTLVPRLSVAGDVIVVPLEGTIDATGTLTGESSGHEATIGTPADYPGLAYLPTSQKLITLTSAAAWSGGPAPTAGAVVTVKATGVQVGLAQVVSTDSTSHVVVLLDGTVSSGNTLHFGAASVTLNAAPVMSKTPSATIRHNLDGRRRDLVGARGDFELSGDAGSVLVWNWTFSGDPAPSADALPVTTSGLSAIRAPRLFAADGALCSYARTTAIGGEEALLQLPTKSASLSAGNSVTPDLDINSAGGARGANVSDRDPTVGYTTNQVLGGFDWEAFRDDSLTVHCATVVGKTPGNICGWVVPNGQVVQANVGDSDGVATHELQIKSRRLRESGDDELVIFQL